MKLEEVLPALRAGKKVRCDQIVFHYPWELVDYLTTKRLESSDWYVVEEPATDEELAAAFEAEAKRCEKQMDPQSISHAAFVLRAAANAVRARKIPEGW